MLHKSAAPSVLVELGFISNADEEKFLNTDEGKHQLTKAIYNAFEAYKHDFDKKTGISVTPKEMTVYKADLKKDSVDENQVIYKFSSSP